MALGACVDAAPTGPSASNLEIIRVHGDGQYGEPGGRLPVPLEVRVQERESGRVAEGVRVSWKVVEGAGATVEPLAAETDSVGSVAARLTLGSDFGVYRVRASVPEMDGGPAVFTAEAVRAPELRSLPAGAVAPGDTILVEGANLAPDPDRNVVLFSGIRGKVVFSQASQLRVEVPSCLPERGVRVRIQIGALSSQELPLQVAGSGQVLLLEPGEDLVADASRGLACIHLPSAPESRYLVMPHTTGTVGAAEYDYTLVGLTSDGVEPVSARPPGPRPAPVAGASLSAMRRGHEQWEGRIRALERQALAGRGPRPETDPSARPTTRAPGAAPALGDHREFSVLSRDNEFEVVSARIRYITENSIVYVDEEVPSGGFTDLDLAGLAREFEDAIHPTVTGYFGQESDLDGNDRVIVLFTPAVNRLTEEDSEGFVGGFFFGVDLLEDREGSNGGEIFYAMVPDPMGEEGPVLARSVVLRALPAILAHEFEHMVHFNQRMLQAGAESQEALWLSEALAQMAEDLVGEVFRRQWDLLKAQDYQMGNWKRAWRYLREPAGVSLLATLPPGTLEERGAGWLFLRHLFGHAQRDDFLLDLTSSVRTGVDNVVWVTGGHWPDLVSEWSAALYLDGSGLPSRPELETPGIDLRRTLSTIDGSYPLDPLPLGGVSFSLPGTLWSSTSDFFIITSPPPGGLALSVSGPDGQPPVEDAAFRFMVVRLR